MDFVAPPHCYSRPTCKEEERVNWHPIWHDGSNISCYRNEVLIGNWDEERDDLKIQSVAKRLPSDFEHYYDSTYHVDYDRGQVPHKVPETLKNQIRRHPHSYESHQPDVDSDYRKAFYNSWETTYTQAYIDVRFQRSPQSRMTFELNDDPCYPTTPPFCPPSAFPRHHDDEKIPCFYDSTPRQRRQCTRPWYGDPPVVSLSIPNPCPDEYEVIYQVLPQVVHHRHGVKLGPLPVPVISSPPPKATLNQDDIPEHCRRNAAPTGSEVLIHIVSSSPKLVGSLAEVKAEHSASDSSQVPPKQHSGSLTDGVGNGHRSSIGSEAPPQRFSGSGTRLSPSQSLSERHSGTLVRTSAVEYPPRKFSDSVGRASDEQIQSERISGAAARASAAADQQERLSGSDARASRTSGGHVPHERISGDARTSQTSGEQVSQERVSGSDVRTSRTSGGQIPHERISGDARSSRTSGEQVPLERLSETDARTSHTSGEQVPQERVSGSDARTSRTSGGQVQQERISGDARSSRTSASQVPPERASESGARTSGGDVPSERASSNIARSSRTSAGQVPAERVSETTARTSAGDVPSERVSASAARSSRTSAGDVPSERASGSIASQTSQTSAAQVSSERVSESAARSSHTSAPRESSGKVSFSAARTSAAAEAQAE